MFEDLFLNKHNKKMLKIAKFHRFKSLIFVGKDNIGKTTIADVLSKEYIPEILWNRNIIKVIPNNQTFEISQISELVDKIKFPPLKLSDNSGFEYFVIIEHCEYLKSNCADVLLKVLEESPYPTTWILITNNLQALPSTVRSRCIVCEFIPLSDDKVKEIFEQQDFDLSPDVYEFIVKWIGGRVGVVFQMTKDAQMLIRLQRIMRICKIIENFKMDQIYKVTNMFDEKNIKQDLEDVMFYFAQYHRNIDLVLLIQKYYKYIVSGVNVALCLDMLMVEIFRFYKSV